MAIDDYYKDSEGNIFVITEQHSGFVWLRNERGDLKQIGKEELKYYTKVGAEMSSKRDSVHLQGIGRFQSIPAKDIVIGRDYFVWNWGNTSKPIMIIKTTPKQIVFKTMTKDGSIYTRRLNKDRQVAFTTEESY